MIVRAFYNALAFPDVLLISVSDHMVTHYEKKENVVKLLDENDNTVGYNITFHPYESTRDGYQMMNEALLDKINHELHQTFHETLVHDFTPYIVVGQVLSCEAHPDSDHLHVCQVDIKDKVLQIVCGASNVAVGQKVVVCLENAVLPSGKFIKNGKLRGIVSNGMLASAYELGLIDEAKKGILVVDDSYQIGQPFFERVRI